MIRKLEKREKTCILAHSINGALLYGPNPKMLGDCSRLFGDCSRLYGHCLSLLGDCTGLRGNCTGVWGYCTGVSGDLDLCEITHDLRKHGVKLEHLIFKSEAEK